MRISSLIKRLSLGLAASMVVASTAALATAPAQAATMSPTDGVTGSYVTTYAKPIPLPADLTSCQDAIEFGVSNVDWAAMARDAAKVGWYPQGSESGLDLSDEYFNVDYLVTGPDNYVDEGYSSYNYWPSYREPLTEGLCPSDFGNGDRIVQGTYTVKLTVSFNGSWVTDKGSCCGTRFNDFYRRDFTQQVSVGHAPTSAHPPVSKHAHVSKACTSAKARLKAAKRHRKHAHGHRAKHKATVKLHKAKKAVKRAC